MMELDVSRKVRDAIKAKLVELGCHVDDELPDYIMILIANRRSNQEIESDLALFLTENTKKFVAWLTLVLKKLEQVTASDGVGGVDQGAELKEIGLSVVIEEKAKEIGLVVEEKAEVDSVVRDDKIKVDGKKSEIKEVEMKVNKPTEPDKVETNLENSEECNSVSKMDEQDPSPGKKKVLIRRNDPVKASKSSNEPKVDSSDTVKQDKHQVVKASISSTSTVDDSGHDTLILDSGENEFSDQVEELRRIALESQEQKRKDSELVTNRVHQRKLITTILMGRVNDEKTQSDSPQRMIRSARTTSSGKYSARSTENFSESSRARHSSYSRSSRRYEKSPIPSRVLRSPRRQERKSVEKHSHDEKPKRRSGRSPVSVFNRIGSSLRRSGSRSRSRSPVRKMTSRIGNVIRRSSLTRSASRDKSPVRNSVCSVVKVTERPKRDLHLNNKMLLRAVADAQQSIIQTEQNSPTKVFNLEKVQDVRVLDPPRSSQRKRTSDETKNVVEVIAKRRFTDFPEVNTTDFYEPTDTTTRRKSVKERLGVKRELRRPVKERLGIFPNHHKGPMDIYENQKFSSSDDYKILINVSDEISGINGKQRSVMLAASDTKRISIQVNNSEEDDSSDDSMVSLDELPPIHVQTAVGLEAQKKYDSNKSQQDKAEFQLAISDEDKLPELPNESDQEVYEYEEIVEEEDPKGNEEDNAAETRELSQTSTTDSQEPNFSITINKATAMPAMTTKYKSNLPDLRTLMSKPVVGSPNGSPGLKCKFWPKCQFKNKCMYEHPKCKYSPCKNKDCFYKHEELTPKSPAKIICKFYPKCTSMNCKFHHPSPCRFGVGCTDSRCENYHPGITLGIQKLRAKGVKFLPKANQLKWIKK